jgi:5-methylcytosine-specific restriction endonuclease McrA
MSRTEFTQPTRKAALKRAELKCEATGSRYGFPEGVRCNCSLSLGVQYDHAVPDALGGDNGLENCMAICIQCHRFKTRNDVKQIAKSNRQRDKAIGVIRPAGKIKGQGFPKSAKAEKASDRVALPARPLYQEAKP